MFILRSYMLLLGLFLAVASCKKEPGEGGNSIIRGKVIERNVIAYNFGSLFLYTDKPFQGENVYIIYGNDDNAPNDRVRTGYDGTFEFNLLRKGKYRVFVYSDDTSVSNFGNQIYYLREVEITKNRSEITVTDLYSLSVNQ